MVTQPRPPAPKPPRSQLGKLTFSLLLIGVGLVALLDLTGFHVPASAYLAVALAAIGLGLLIGAWFGRARAMIALGIVATIALVGTSTAERYRDDFVGGSVSWRPDSVTEIQARYQHNFGDATLDLTNVDFTGQEVDIRVDMDFGSIRIELPDDVDVRVDARVAMSGARVFDEEWGGGFGNDTRRITDNGLDGEGGGTLNLDVRVDFGDLEVQR
jgi:predicted membrane protein